MVNKLAMVLFTVTVVAMLTLQVNAALVPMSWGFPVLVQDNSLTDLENSFAFATDIESADISFPTTTGITAFPTITQVSNASNMLSQFRFQNQQQSMKFAYPWISIGFSPVPSMGFL
jgi:uncharacterized protein YybS (DUF2232 family)